MITALTNQHARDWRKVHEMWEKQGAYPFECVSVGVEQNSLIGAFTKKAGPPWALGNIMPWMTWWLLPPKVTNNHHNTVDSLWTIFSVKPHYMDKMLIFQILFM
jgi:hypothetical protein